MTGEGRHASSIEILCGFSQPREPAWSSDQPQFKLSFSFVRLYGSMRSSLAVPLRCPVHMKARVCVICLSVDFLLLFLLAVRLLSVVWLSPGLLAVIPVHISDG